jgi:hypothetical protein
VGMRCLEKNRHQLKHKHIHLHTQLHQVNGSRPVWGGEGGGSRGEVAALGHEEGGRGQGEGSKLLLCKGFRCYCQWRVTESLLVVPVPELPQVLLLLPTVPD